MSKAVPAINKLKNPEHLVDEVVFIHSGKHRGRIAYCDDYEGRTLILSFGHYLLTAATYDVRCSFVRLANLNDLVSRYSEITNCLGRANWLNEPLLPDEEISLLYEKVLIPDRIWELEKMAMHKKTDKGKTLFLSHSSKDKGLVRQIHVDLQQLGHNPWLDEIEIKVAESIIDRISNAIGKCDFVILIYSESAASSHWVKAEWETLFLYEVSRGDVRILVARIDNAELPAILKRKKYADFRKSYDQGLSEILSAIGHQPEPQEAVTKT